MTRGAGFISVQESVSGLIANVLEGGKDLNGTWHDFAGAAAARLSLCCTFSCFPLKSHSCLPLLQAKRSLGDMVDDLIYFLSCQLRGVQADNMYSCHSQHGYMWIAPACSQNPEN